MFMNQDQQAQNLFEERQYMEAEKKFSGNYNKGVSFFRNADYEKAEKYFSMEAGNNIDAEYNMGNAQLMQMKLTECIKTFESVLKKYPSHNDAKTNLDICKKMKNNPKNKDKSNQPQDKKQDNNKQKDKQDQQDGDKQKQEEPENKQQQETDGNEKKKELDIQAKSILSKISSDPSKLMQNRFKYEEGKAEEVGKGKSENPRPW